MQIRFFLSICFVLALHSVSAQEAESGSKNAKAVLCKEAAANNYQNDSNTVVLSHKKNAVSSQTINNLMESSPKSESNPNIQVSSKKNPNHSKTRPND